VHELDCVTNARYVFENYPVTCLLYRVVIFFAGELNWTTDKRIWAVCSAT